MRNIKCKYCGKIYASPREMRKRKCRSHPNGCWGGYCRPDSMDEFLWVTEENRELTRRSLENLERMEREQKQAEAEFALKYKKHTPLLDYMLVVGIPARKTGGAEGVWHGGMEASEAILDTLAEKGRLAR